MDYAKESLRLHEQWGGKIEVNARVPVSTKDDLSLAYTPGVAQPCLEIRRDPDKSYTLTRRHNLCAVITDGSAVLGLGDIGPEAGMPVMEGKCVLFKAFADVDAFPLCIRTQDVDEFVRTVYLLSGSFGGINLEDISAPRCFEIERKLKELCDIPVFHDDQHGTAIITLAGLTNALRVVGKRLEDVKIVVSGAGAAAISISKLLLRAGARDVTLCDRKGAIYAGRAENMNWIKTEMAEVTNLRRQAGTLADVVRDADVFIGVSQPGLLTGDMVRTMHRDAIVFACANPTPEIFPEEARAAGAAVVSTGRSDYPNQINNVLGFPYIFRGALDTHAKAINEEMKRAAVYAIADLAKEPVPDVVNAAYKLKRTTFGRDYILPKALDPRLLTRVSCAVAKAAIDSGVSRKTITDWEGYANHLREMMGYDNKLLRSFTDMAKANPKRVVFAEANHVNMLKAAAEAKAEGICFPILLGNEERLAKIAAEENISLEGIEIVNLRHDRETERRHRYARILSDKKAREGVTYSEACEKMVDRNAFGMMMVATGDADAFVTGVYSRYSEVTKMAEQIIGIRPSYKHFGALNILTCKKGTFFMADTLINRHPSAEVLIDIARLTHDAVKFFAHEPVMAMLSYSNFGADKQGSPLKVHEAIDFLHKTYPDMVVDGEMQVNFALDKKLRDDMYPFNKLKGQDVNTLIFPNLSSANSAYKLLDTLGITETIGPIQMGLNKPIHFTDVESSTRDIVNLTTVAVVDAIVQEQIEKENR